MAESLTRSPPGLVWIFPQGLSLLCGLCSKKVLFVTFCLRVPIQILNAATSTAMLLRMVLSAHQSVSASLQRYATEPCQTWDRVVACPCQEAARYSVDEASYRAH